MKKILLILILQVAINVSYCHHNFNFDTYNLNDTLVEHVYDSINLDSGVIYTIQVEGTYSIWSPNYWSNPCGTIENSPIFPSSSGFMTGNVSCDMEYFFSYPTTSLCNTATFPNATSRIEISLDNGQSWFHPSSTNAYNSAHIYNYQITGMGAPIGIRQIAVHNSDDYGILKFTLRPQITGIEQLSISPKSFSVYPNPTTKNIYIENSDMQIKSISIQSMSGQIMNIDYSIESKILLDLSQLPKGIYLMGLETTDQLGFEKIIIK